MFRFRGANRGVVSIPRLGVARRSATGPGWLPERSRSGSSPPRLRYFSSRARRDSRVFLKVFGGFWSLRGLLRPGFRVRISKVTLLIRAGELELGQCCWVGGFSRRWYGWGCETRRRASCRSGLSRVVLGQVRGLSSWSWRFCHFARVPPWFWSF
jgi:hypothetical protein